VRKGLLAVSKKRTDLVAALQRGRALAAEAAHEDDRTDRVASGLAALWPAPLHACLLGGRLSVRDEAGRPRPEWEDLLRAELSRCAEAEPGKAAASPLAVELGLADHFLHGVAVGRAGRRYGALALALHKRTTDAALAQAALMHLADHLAFLLYLREQERQARGRWADLADLANLTAHEFNNTLNSIGLQLATLGPKGLQVEHVPELAEVRRQVREGGTRSRQLQEFCHREQAGARTADLNRAVRAAVETAAPGAAVRLELADDLPAVHGTDLDLERLAGALAGAAAAAGGAVAVRTGRGGESGVWLSVEDDGPAPDEDELPHLFEPFVAVRPGDDGYSRAVARAIARRLGGGIRAERRAGGGMVFVVDLREAGP
jgi:signal transduction histidine kinase